MTERRSARLPFSETRLPRIVDAINILAQQGWLEVTLAANAGTTTVEVLNLSPTALVTVDPVTATARAMTTLYVDATDVTAGQVVITHDNDANTDKRVLLRWNQ